MRDELTIPYALMKKRKICVKVICTFSLERLRQP